MKKFISSGNFDNIHNITTKKSMKKGIFLFLCCFALVLNSYSQTKKESIIELFRLMHKDSMLDRTISSRLPALIQIVQQTNPSHAMTEGTKDSIIDRLQIFKEFSVKIQNEEIALYDKYFTQEEINEMIAFYKSGTGHKLAEVTPKIQNDLMMILLQKYSPEMIRLNQLLKNQK